MARTHAQLISKALLLTTLAVLLTAATACSCAPPHGIRSRLAGHNAVVTASVIATLDLPAEPSRFAQTVYWMRVRRAVKGCRVPPVFSAVSDSVGTSCELTLLRGRSYLLPYVSGAPVQTLSLCDFTLQMRFLSKREKRLIRASRPKCCSGPFCPVRQCESEPVRCGADPCSLAAPPCPNAVKCASNFCGGCFTDWYDANGERACIHHRKLTVAPS